MTASTTADSDRPHRGRRLTWEEFRRLTGREPPKAANDDYEYEDKLRARDGCPASTHVAILMPAF